MVPETWTLTELKSVHGETETRRAEIQKQLHAVEDYLRELRLRVVELEYGVRAGSVVKDQHGNLHQVVQVEAQYWTGNTKPWLKTRPQKKDGTWSECYRNLYSRWELVEEAT